MSWGVVCAALGFTGCKDDDTPSLPKPERVTLSVTAENTYGEELAVVWNEGDRIGIFAAATLNGVFSLTGQAGTAAGEFEGEIAGPPETYYAYYPYDAAATLKDAAFSLTIPDVQTYVPGKLMPRIPMVGTSSSAKIQMQNVCGVLAVKVVAERAVEVESVTFRTSGGQKAAGEARVGFRSGISLSVVMSDTGSDAVTLNVPNGGLPIAAGDNALLYIALPPQTYDGAEICVATESGAQETLTLDHPLTVGCSELTEPVEVVFKKQAESKPQTGTDLNDPARYGISPGDPEVYANCYLVHEAGAYFLDATVIGNGPGGLHSDGGFHTQSVRIAPRSAALLWEEVEGTVTDVKLSDGGTYLTFNAARIPGNAVLAVYDGERGTGDILWSWHIWLSEKPRDHQYKDANGAGTYLVMDRNLGAAFAPATDVQADIEAMTDAQRYASYGLYYQWGRKDPFWGCASVSGMKDKVVFGQVTTITKIGYAATGDDADNNLLYAVRHPVDYILMNKSTLHWTGTPVKNLWGNPSGYENGGKGLKTIYDPCPVGYMVSPCDLWSASGFESAYVGKFKRGRMFSYDGENVAWYPGGGLRWEDDGALGDVGIAGYYWSNSVFDAAAKGACEYLFFMSSTEIFTTNAYASASGHNVRCVRE